MGTWSHEPFGNDTACDWAYGLQNANDLSYIEETLDKALAVGAEFLEAPDAEEAVAAAEVLAKLRGNGSQSDAYTNDIDKWVKHLAIHPLPELLKKAKQVLQRILAEDSELLELWEEADDSAQWRSSIEKLLATLSA